MSSGPAPGRAADPAADGPSAASRGAASPARTIFFGSGTFAVPILEAVAAHPALSLVGVVTAPDRPAGRGRAVRPTPVALRARAMWVPLLQPPRVRAPDVIAELEALGPDIGVLADFGQVIPAELLALPRHGILNVHPSLLPRHRGATPIPATIVQGDEFAGVTIIQMDDGIDTGPIVARRGWALEGTERAPDLEARAAREGAELLRGTMERWLTGELQAVPQDGAEASTTRPFRRADARLDPHRPAIELERHVRAHAPWPGSFIETADGRLAVHGASVAASEPGDEPGQLVRHGGRLALTTGDGRLVLDEVQLAGGRTLGGAEFLRGHERLAGTPVGPQAAIGPQASPVA